MVGMYILEVMCSVKSYMIVLEFVEQTVTLSVMGVQNREDEKNFPKSLYYLNMFIVNLLVKMSFSFS
jgi:hypothetical protein